MTLDEFGTVHHDAILRLMRAFARELERRGFLVDIPRTAWSGIYVWANRREMPARGDLDLNYAMDKANDGSVAWIEVVPKVGRTSRFPLTLDPIPTGDTETWRRVFGLAAARCSVEEMADVFERKHGRYLPRSAKTWKPSR